MNVKTPASNQQPSWDRPHGTVRWFGEFGLQAVAADSVELAAAIEDFLRDYPLARGRREGLRYMLQMVPMGRRMHMVTVEPSPPDGTTLDATIPVGRPVSRRAQLTTIGWALERAISGTRYYRRRFLATDAAPTDIVTAVDQANRVLYGSRANDIRWSLNVSPRYIDGQARDAGESRAARPLRRAARTTRRASWSARLDFPCLLVSSVISLILVVPLMFAVVLGVRWIAARVVEWSGPVGARLFAGLIGLAMLGLGSKALFAVFTGGPMGASKPRVVVASLFIVLLGLGFFLLAVVPWDTRGF